MFKGESEMQMRNLNWAVGALAVAAIFAVAVGEGPDAKRTVTLQGAHSGVTFGECDAVQPACTYRPEVFAPLSTCDSKEECNKKAREFDVCKNDEGINEGKTTTQKDANGANSCWGECNNGKKWFALCGGYVMHWPTQRAPLKRERIPRGGR
jgi:hypothetical protein